MMVRPGLIRKKSQSFNRRRIQEGRELNFRIMAQVVALLMMTSYATCYANVLSESHQLVCDHSGDSTCNMQGNDCCLTEIGEVRNKASVVALRRFNLEASWSILGIDCENFEQWTRESGKGPRDRFELAYTPKHCGWLNMAEIELNVLTRYCLN